MAKSKKYRQWLKDIRTQMNLTQQQVAKRAGIARTTYASIEKGDRNASVPNAKNIANVLGFDWTLFFEDVVHNSSRESHSA
ncbi:helix-turn-helix transcriptional regulator [Bacillus paralicheniformis]|uniref:helix-turn-helix transcriptional regulator n=2 Tax=Bacteria TaxID=2 RepID=UPI002867FFF9|nr:helix-turn-helix transcriptional regulator [Bacillus paralicheniformis]WMW46649.1 helix-turn-helix transcriptional regulator [Bacillus paralicheniformis]